MIGLIPAILHFKTASLTSILGGSILPATPKNIKSHSTDSFLTKFSALYAAAIHLSALLDIASI